MWCLAWFLAGVVVGILVGIEIAVHALCPRKLAVNLGLEAQAPEPKNDVKEGR